MKLMCYLHIQSPSLARARASLRTLPDRIARTVRDPWLAEQVHRVVSRKVDAATAHLIAADLDDDDLDNDDDGEVDDGAPCPAPDPNKINFPEC